MEYIWFVNHYEKPPLSRAGAGASLLEHEVNDARDDDRDHAEVIEAVVHG
jgi:hypothetical protein